MWSAQRKISQLYRSSYKIDLEKIITANHPCLTNDITFSIGLGGKSAPFLSTNVKEDTLIWNTCKFPFIVYHFPDVQKKLLPGTYYSSQCYTHSHPYWLWQNKSIRYDMTVSVGVQFAVIKDYEDLGNTSLVVLFHDICCECVSADSHLINIKDSSIDIQQLTIVSSIIGNKKTFDQLTINTATFQQFLAICDYKWDTLSVEEKSKVLERLESTDVEEMKQVFHVFIKKSSSEIFTEDLLLLYYGKMEKANAIDIDEYISYSIFTINPNLFTKAVYLIMEEKGLLSDDHWLKEHLPAVPSSEEAEPSDEDDSDE
jgi:hypothetical protein